MKYISQIIGIIISFILSACAQPPLSNQQVKYQAASNQVLAKYAGAVSRGFIRKSPTQYSKSKGFIDYGNSSSEYPMDYSSFGQPTVDYNAWNQANGGVAIKQAIGQEVQDCVKLIKDVSPTCGNYPFMVASLSRCLDRVISYRNPLLTYSYQNLDQQGQQYWTYLQNWRQPAELQSFGVSDFSRLNPYAAGGYIGQDAMFE